METTRSSQLAALLVACLLLAGCGSKLTADRFDKVKTGMTLSQVQRILGKPSGVVRATDNAKLLGWESGNRIITIIMDKDGKVFVKDQVNLP